MATAVEPGGPRRYATYAALVALLAGLALLPLALANGGSWLWGYLAGWGAMATIGAAGGAGLVARHGGRSGAFVVVMIACMLARLSTVVVGAVLLWWMDLPPVGFLVGIAVGFVPLQILEGVWFYRSGGGDAIETLIRISGRKPTA